MSTSSRGYVMLTLVFGKEGNKWVGTCEELGTSTYARTLKQCQHDLNELVIEHLNLLEQEGEREKFFERWGIKIQPTKTPKDFTFHVSSESTFGAHRDLLQETLSPSRPPFFRPSLFQVPSRQRRREKETATA